jgi:RNA polymerase sigma-70 factor (family 1)
VDNSINLTALLLQISQGNERAFRAVFDELSPRVYRYALQLTRDQAVAEEILQDVFLKIWTRRETLPEIDNFPGYVHIVTRNHCFNALKKLAQEQKTKEMVKLSAKTALNNEIEEFIFYKESRAILEKAVAGLPAQQRKVYNLCHVEGLKYEEAAERLHISPLTVKKHMQTALGTLRSKMRGITP